MHTRAFLPIATGLALVAICLSGGCKDSGARTAGDLAAADDGFAAAQSAYRIAGDDRKAAEMANNRCVVLVGLGRGEEAVRVVEGTAGVFASGGDPVMAAKAAGNLAALDGRRLTKRPPPTSGRRFQAGDRASESETWQALSRLQLRRGDAFGAAASAQAALDSGPKPGPFRRLLRRITAKAFRFPRV
jgi:hypothetical protein